METTRYNRQIILPEVGTAGQEKLLQSKILIIGVGGLGSAVLPYLVAAGVGEIGIIDDDKIDISNLQRQVIYNTNSVGKSKVVQVKEMGLALNPSIKINAISEKLEFGNAIALFEKYDIIVDATDNLNTKYLINDACCVTNKPFVYGSIYKFEGQVSVFNYKNGPTYRCLFPETVTNSSDCNELGVLGVAVGIIGMFQANEVLKMILKIGKILSGRLLVYNMLTNEQQKFEFCKTVTQSYSLQNFENKYAANNSPINEILSDEALEQINNPQVVFLDVRNADEIPKIDIENTMQIPLDNLEKELWKLDSNKKFFIFCQSGIRSKKAVEILLQHNFKNVKSIIGGAKSLTKFTQTDSILRK